MRLTAEQWKDLLLNTGIQASDEDAAWLEPTGDSLRVDQLPDVATEPQLVQVPRRWERQP